MKDGGTTLAVFIWNKDLPICLQKAQNVHKQFRLKQVENKRFK